MKLFTSNFRIAGLNHHAVSIANGRRFYGHVPQYQPLIPPWKMVEAARTGRLQSAGFERAYREQLSGLDPHRVLAELEAFGPEVILLCWEAPGKECHRRLAAQWLETELGIRVPELGLLSIEIPPA